MSTTHELTAIGYREDFLFKNFPSEWQYEQDCIVKTLLSGGRIYAYSFGSLVFVGVPAIEISIEIDTLRKLLGLTLAEKVVTETFIIEENSTKKPRVEFSKIIIDTLSFERLKIITLTLAQSVSLKYYERLVKELNNKVLIVGEKLKETGKLSIHLKGLNKIIGETICYKSEVIGVLRMLDRPDATWNDKIIDTLYVDLRAAFDLTERFKSLEKKLDSIQYSISALTQITQDRRLYMADWIIILLIAVEIIFTLLTRFHLLGW